MSGFAETRQALVIFRESGERTKVPGGTHCEATYRAAWCDVWMGRVGLASIVILLSAAARATEPSAAPPSASTATYAPVALTEQKPPPAPREQFDMPRMPAHPLRASLSSSEVLAVGAGDVSPRMIRVVLETESVASFPVDDEEEPVSVPALPRPRLLSIRRNLDDDGSVFERAGATHRLIRRTLDDSSDFAPVSAARRLRTSLD